MALKIQIKVKNFRFNGSNFEIQKGKFLEFKLFKCFM